MTFGHELCGSRRGDQAPVLGAVGPMQFEVVEERMSHDFGAAIRSDVLPYQLARRTDKESALILGHDRQVEVLRRSDGTGTRRGLIIGISRLARLRREMA